MVVTRRMAALAGVRPVRANPRTGMRQRRRWPKRYKPQDVAHRHRIPDPQPKTQQVVAYRRRT